ncbi:MAG: RsmB/NOP family class I SAM-dependent RNA methyltransferase [Pseudomonadota bacterium]
MNTPPPPLAPRRAALDWVGLVLSGNAIIGADPFARKLDMPSDRATAKRLADAILRHRANLDGLMQPFLQRRPPNSIRNIFYLVLVETQLFNSPDFALVHTCVELAKRDPGTKGKFAGLTNAVARKLIALPKGALIARKAPKLPKPLRGPMIAAYGQAVVDAMETAHLHEPLVDLCVKSESLIEHIETGQRFAPHHLRLSKGTALSEVEVFRSGDAWVQDLAAQQPVWSLGAIEGLSVLDLCAAPGGKTMQLAAAGAKVTALDLSEARMARVSENLHRTGLEAELVTADALVWDPDQTFDLIVLDAPCSATGTIRRHPDLPYLKSSTSIKDLVALQRSLTRKAVSLLKPGGRLLFVTCSLLPAEGEAQADWIEASFPQIRPAALKSNSITAPAITAHRCRLRPDMQAPYGGMDGFFFALYQMEIQ